jgi:hypothetical protein
MKRVSPFDFYMVGGTEPKKAAALIEVCRAHPDNLEQMIGVDGWFEDVIKSLVADDTHYQRNSMSSFKNKELDSRLLKNNEIEYIKFHGKLLRELFKGTSIKLDDKKSTYVEMIVYVCGDKVIYAKQQKANSPEFRPYFTSAYEKLNGSSHGIAILQRVHKACRVARSMVFASIRNASYTARPTGEIDKARLTEFNNEKDLGHLNIGTFLHAAPDITGKQGGHTPAVTLYDIPNHMSQYQAGITFFMDLIDLLSAVPKISSGDMRGLATLGRSFRGIAMVQAAESKATKGALDNFDRDIQEPIFLSMYNELLEDNKNNNVKGDIRVKARATSGYTTKEAKAAARSEGLQYLAPFAAQLPPEVVQALLYSVVSDMGVDIERYTGKPTAAQTGLTEPPVTSTPSFGGETIRV